jgi:enoyl-CoA hydratase
VTGGDEARAIQPTNGPAPHDDVAPAHVPIIACAMLGRVISVTVERRPVDGGTVAVVALNDPDRRNILSPPLVDAVASTFDELEADGAVGAVVLTGAGRAFCAGADLSDLGAGGQAAEAHRAEALKRIYSGFLRVARSSLPTIAAVNGPAVGAGMNLALACDVRLVARSGRFDTRFLRLNIHPGGGHMWMLQRAIGPQAAAAMVLFGRVADAEEAVRLGLALEAVDDEALLDRAVELATPAAAAPRNLIERMKRELALPAAEHEAALDRELEAQVWSMGQPAFADQLAALQRTISSSRQD